MTDCCIGYGKHSSWDGESRCAIIHIGSEKQSSKSVLFVWGLKFSYFCFLFCYQISYFSYHQWFSFLLIGHLQGGLVKAGLDVAQIWLDGTETLVNTIDRDGNMLPINMIDGHAITHDPLVVLVSSTLDRCFFRFHLEDI